MNLLRLIIGAIVLGSLTAVAVLLFGIRLFVVQPIGALPDGGAVLMHSRPNLQLVDSPDAVCMRKQGYVSLLCRAAALGAIGEGDTIILRLPYSDWLYRLSGAPEVDR